MSNAYPGSTPYRDDQGRPVDGPAQPQDGAAFPLPADPAADAGHRVGTLATLVRAARR